MSNLGSYRECITPPALTKNKWSWSIRKANRVVFLCGIPMGIVVALIFLSSMDAIILISTICVLTFIIWGVKKESILAVNPKIPISISVLSAIDDKLPVVKKSQAKPITPSQNMELTIKREYSDTFGKIMYYASAVRHSKETSHIMGVGETEALAIADFKKHYKRRIKALEEEKNCPAPKKYTTTVEI